MTYSHLFIILIWEKFLWILGTSKQKYCLLIIVNMYTCVYTLIFFYIHPFKNQSVLCFCSKRILKECEFHKHVIDMKIVKKDRREHFHFLKLLWIGGFIIYCANIFCDWIWSTKATDRYWHQHKHLIFFHKPKKLLKGHRHENSEKRPSWTFSFSKVAMNRWFYNNLRFAI
jgi:hypothetical protein